jgi:hypothetical protein
MADADTKARTRVLYVPIGSVRVNPRKLHKLSQTKIRGYQIDYEAGDDFRPSPSMIAAASTPSGTAGIATRRNWPVALRLLRS